MVHESGLLTNLQRPAWNNNKPLCIYSGPAYPLSIHLQASFSRRNLTPKPVNYNKTISQIRVSVERLFNEIKLTSQMKIRLSAVDKIYCICVLLQNVRTYLYGNLISEFFQLDPPLLEDYFHCLEGNLVNLICLGSLALLFIL